MNDRPSRQSGLTLIEVMLAVLIVACVAGAFYHVLGQGFHIWRTALREKPEYEFDMMFERLAHELRNAIQHEPAPFIGKETGFEFYTSGYQNKNPVFSEYAMPMKVIYQHDRSARHFSRAEVSYDLILKGRGKPEPFVMLGERVSDLDVQYYYRNANSSSTRWGRKWNRACFPNALKITMDYEASGQRQRMTRILSVPIGGRCPA